MRAAEQKCVTPAQCSMTRFIPIDGWWAVGTESGGARSSRLLSLSPGACWLFSTDLTGAMEAVPDPDVDVEATVAAAFDEALVRGLVDRLPPRERTVIQLRYGFCGDPLTY